jgi:hypothetical protein
MTDKEKADCLIELHRVQMDHFRQTRDIEFKVNLALWTAILLVGYFLYTQPQITKISWLVYWCISGLLIAGHLFLWQMPIQNSEDTDDHFINKYRSIVEELTEAHISKPPEKSPKWLWWPQKKFRKHGWSWIIFEVSITAILLVCLWLVLSSKPTSSLP